MPKADPVLLEPMDHVTVSVPNSYTATAQRLLTGRRGQILGYAERPGWPGWDDVEALVPEAELHDFIIELRSQTMGLGTYRHAVRPPGRGARQGGGRGAENGGRVTKAMPGRCPGGPGIDATP